MLIFEISRLAGPYFEWAWLGDLDAFDSKIHTSGNWGIPNQSVKICCFLDISCKVYKINFRDKIDKIKLVRINC